jgi:hypothetical protein
MSRFLFAIVIMLSTNGIACAQTMTGAVDIGQVRTGWWQDAFAVVTVQPVINPANCATPDGYISAKEHPGYQTYLSATLTAFAIGVPVVVTVSDTDCGSDRPILIGINPTLPGF